MDLPRGRFGPAWALAVLLLLGILGSGCDLLGSDSGPPAWTGNWQVTTLDGEPPSQPRYWSITRSEWDIVQETADGGCSVLARGSITDRSDNVVTATFDDETLELRLEVADDTLTSTLVSGPSSADDVVRARSIDFDPFNRLDCPSAP